MSKCEQNHDVDKSKLEFDWNEPSKVVAAIFKPVVNQQKHSPPSAVALGCFLLVFVPHWSSVESWADLPVNDDHDPIKRIKPYKLLPKKRK